MNPDPVYIQIGNRNVAFRWSSRAAYRIDTLKPRPTLEDARAGGSDGMAFVIAHVWAGLSDERDRRRYPSPEDLAADYDAKRADERGMWRAVFLDAFGVDLDAVKDETPAASTNEAPKDAAHANPSTGTAS
jgi:hypothetical protein